MLPTFSAILPIFLLIVFGQGLRHLPLFSTEFWRGLDVMGFYVLYPALLFVTIVRADFSSLSFDVIVIALAIAGTAIALFTLAIWPMLRDRIALDRPAFSSVFQTTVRWNGFIAFAVAEKLFPPEGAAMVALVMAVVIIPINMESVAVVAWFTAKSPNLGAVLRRIAVNPLVLAATAALILRSLPFDIPGPLMEMLNLVARAALGMGLMAIGAGLRPQDALRPNAAVLLAAANKLIVFPAMVIAVAIALGLDGQQLSYLALCAAVPTAMNGYVLARQMGGDAELYAAIATIQTAVSFVSIPVILAVVAQLSAG
ncbi:MAG: AEC family transporter [Oricola sp.]